MGLDHLFRTSNLGNYKVVTISQNACEPGMYDKCLIVCASGSLGECELPVVCTCDLGTFALCPDSGCGWLLVNPLTTVSLLIDTRLNNHLSIVM